MEKKLKIKQIIFDYYTISLFYKKIFILKYINLILDF